MVGGTGLSAAAPRPVSSHAAAELAPNSANMMTAWTDKLYTENMGIIFTNAVTPSAVASSAGMAAVAAAAASSASAGSGVYTGGGMLMNNGRQDTTDTSLADIQKLQQQLQDIKDQVRHSPGTHTRTFYGPLDFVRDCLGDSVAEPIWILLKHETVSGSGISWAICKSAPRLRQITMPVPHHSVFYRLDAFPSTQPTASKH